MKIRITEILSREIEAESVAEVADKYSAGEIVLDSADFIEYSITEVRE
jgi:hypothetical protein